MALTLFHEVMGDFENFNVRSYLQKTHVNTSHTDVTREELTPLDRVQRLVSAQSCGTEEQRKYVQTQCKINRLGLSANSQNNDEIIGGVVGDTISAKMITSEIVRSIQHQFLSFIKKYRKLLRDKLTQKKHLVQYRLLGDYTCNIMVGCQ